MAKLINTREKSEYYIVTDPVTIGRHDSNKIALPGSAMSRFHAKIMVADGEYCIQDLGSTYGTYINGERVRPMAPVLTPLEDGDLIQLGVLSTLGDAAYHLVFSVDNVPEESAGWIRGVVAARRSVEPGRTTIESRDGILIACLCGAFRGAECEVMADDIAACVATRKRNVVIDLNEVTHMNSYAIGVFVGLRDRLRESNAKLTFARAGGHVLKLLTRAGLVELFGCWRTLREARKKLLK